MKNIVIVAVIAAIIILAIFTSLNRCEINYLKDDVEALDSQKMNLPFYDQH